LRQCYLPQGMGSGITDSCESRCAHYVPGDYYRRHYDALNGDTNRILSLMVFLNPDWAHGDGGELVLYRDAYDQEGLNVTPGRARSWFFSVMGIHTRYCLQDVTTIRSTAGSGSTPRQLAGLTRQGRI